MKRFGAGLLCVLLLFCGTILFSGAALADAELKAIISMDELNSEDVRIGVLTGSIGDQIARDRFPNAELKYLESATDLTQAMLVGQIDAFIYDEPIIREIQRQVPEVTVLDEYLVDDCYACAAAKTEEGIALTERLSAFISEYRENGTLAEMDALWFGDDDALKVVDDSVLTGENGTLKIAFNPVIQPFCYVKDNRYTGFIVDLLVRFCAENGYAIQWQPMDFAAIIPSLLSGKSDLAGDCISVTEERKEQISFAEPFYYGGLSVAVRKPVTGEAGDTPVGFLQSIAASFEKTFIREARWKLILQGIGTTALITVASAFFGTLIGFGVCLLRRMRNPVASGFAKVYIRLLQGTPIVVLLMILFYVVFSGSGISGELVAIIGFSLNFGAYVSEMIRTGIDAVDRGQTEAALALGYTKRQAFLQIVLPQAANHFLPVYRGELVSLAKSTSVVGYIAVQDLTKMGDIIRSRTYEAFFPLLVTAAIYFIIAGILTALLGRLESRFQPRKKNRCVKGVKML